MDYIFKLAVTCFLIQQTMGDYCQPNAALPNITQFACPGCKDRCGEPMSFNKTTESPTKYKTCSCSEHCLVYGDCCHDFPVECPELYVTATKLSSLYDGIQKTCKFWPMGFKVPVPEEVLLLSSCAATGTLCNVSYSSLEEVNRYIPVVDLDTGLQYINADCALCNGVSRAKPWATEMLCSLPQIIQILDIDQDHVVNSTGFLGNLITAASCSVAYLPLETHAPAKCMMTHDKCPDDCENQVLVDHCTGNYQVFSYGGTNYKNVYCGLCNGADEEGIVCGYVIRYLPGVSQPDGEKYALPLSIDFNPEYGLTIGRDLPKCERGTVWKESENTCEPIVCPANQNLSQGICQFKIQNITFTTAVHYDNESPSPTQLELQYKKLFTNFKHHASKKSIFYGLAVKSVESKWAMERNGKVMATITILYSFESATNEETFAENAISFLKDMVSYLNIQIMSQLETETGPAVSSHLIETDENLKNLQCTWESYSQSEVTVNIDSATIIKTGKEYNLYIEQSNHTVLICENKDDTSVSRGVLHALGVINLVTMLSFIYFNH